LRGPVAYLQPPMDRDFANAALNMFELTQLGEYRPRRLSEEWSEE
jgi:hypothetical protein